MNKTCTQIVRYVYCTHQMLLPTSRGCWDSIPLQYAFLAQKVLACNMKTSIQTHSNKSYSLIIFVSCYHPNKYSRPIIKLKFIMRSITIKEWGLRGPFIELSILRRIILTKKRNCGQDITCNRDHDSWSINGRLRLGWGHRHRYYSFL